MKIYTRTGDDGTTGLGSRRRVSKATLRVEAYGTVDELNSVLGVARATGLGPVCEAALQRVQAELFALGSDLCIPAEDKESWPVPSIEQDQITALEHAMDELDADLEPLKNFILPGGSASAAHLHLARTVARRCERLLVRLQDEESIDPLNIRYLNRLSDALFVMARAENHRQGVDDVVWSG